MTSDRMTSSVTAACWPVWVVVAGHVTCLPGAQWNWSADAGIDKPDLPLIQLMGVDRVCRRSPGHALGRDKGGVNDGGWEIGRDGCGGRVKTSIETCIVLANEVERWNWYEIGNAWLVGDSHCPLWSVCLSVGHISCWRRWCGSSCHRHAPTLSINIQLSAPSLVRHLLLLVLLRLHPRHRRSVTNVLYCICCYLLTPVSHRNLRSLLLPGNDGDRIKTLCADCRMVLICSWLLCRQCDLLYCSVI